MRVLVSAIALLVVASASASAEELKRRTFIRATPAPVFSWTGFYVGGNIGCARQVARPSTPIVDGDGDPTAMFPISYSGTGGCFVGAQGGYNYQFMGNWVAGIEADGHFVSMSGAGQLREVEGATNEALGLLAHQTTSFGTVRGRLGYVWNVPNTMGILTYVTGGWAWANSKATVLATDQFPPNIFSADSRRLSGYAVGTGAEMAIMRNWSVKIEYLFMDLGSATYNTLFYDDTVANSAPLIINTKIHSFKLGANYHFDWMR